MLRNLLILVICAVGAAAAVPALFEARSGMGSGGQAPAAAEKVAAPRRAGPAGRAVSIPADAQGHFRAEFKINGRRVSGLIDTGATLVAINASTARRLGIALKASDFRHSVSTANGEARAAAATIRSLQIGRIHVENVEAAVLDDRALGGTLIGMSFLRRLDAYRVENGELLLKQ